MSETNSELVVEGKRLNLSNLNKIFYPKTGFTKHDIIAYYIKIAPFLLPHLKNRALTMKRFPEGIHQFFFYERRCPSYRPNWVNTVQVHSKTQGTLRYCTINNLPTLIWLVNLADLELHTSLATAKNPDRPTMIVFDLDPGSPATIYECAEVALLIRQKLSQLELKSWIKTSGSKGLQLYIPLNSPVTYDKTKSFAHILAKEMEKKHPKKIVSRMAKNLRTGKVLIDWSQNDFHKTTICAYSLRAKEAPTVSTPVTWEEVEKAYRQKKMEYLNFTSDDVLQRVQKWGDLMADVLTFKQKLPNL
ncbi:MAG: non-homologous end-joining DNA ligase [Verrucomicrobiae bacterium]|nr:non-homologous end-joining DNA ligase [Verrucomicrobiae bacterium]